MQQSKGYITDICSTVNDLIWCLTLIYLLHWEAEGLGLESGKDLLETSLVQVGVGLYIENHTSIY